jgi:hypothetical protein
LRLRFDDLNSVVELYSQDDFRQEAVAFEAAPALLGSLRELEDHRQRGLVGEATLRSSRTMTDGSKCALDWVCGPQVFPMLGGKVVEGEQCITILGPALGRFLVLAAVGLDEDVKSGFGVFPGLRHPDVVQRAVGLGVQAVRQLVEDVAAWSAPDQGGRACGGRDERDARLLRLPRKALAVLCQEDARASCCMRDEGRPFGVAL